MADTDYLAASDGSGNAALMHITSPRTALATIIQVDTVTGVPAFFVGTWGTLGADGFITAASARDFFGHVNAGTLVIDKMAPGNVDGGNTSGQVVVIKPSTPVQNLVGNFIKTSLNNFGEGVLLNGKIVPSITSNNLVVAIKTLNGVDPSTSDVVYVRIGGTVRTITAPLSVTLAAGTNWFSKGSAPLGGISTTFFAYLGWNATDGVTLGVSSTAHAIKYSDFSTTNTDWTYAKISTITTAAATDVYENIGRFNAILGVSATFLWTLPAAGALINAAQPTPAIMNYPYRFRVWRNAAENTVAGTTTVLYDSKTYDLANNVDVVTNKGRFTAPVSGFYFFTAAIQVVSTGSMQLQLAKNGVVISTGANEGGSGVNQGSVVTDVLELVAGDYVEVFVASATAVAIFVSQSGCYFTGYLQAPI